jgi:hypothetical protein
MKRVLLPVLILFVFGSVASTMKNVEFFLSSMRETNLTQSTTILLAENISSPLFIVESKPPQTYFSLNHDITHNLIYLTFTYITSTICLHSSYYSLVLSNQMEFYVTIVYTNECLFLPHLITIEYMFKYEESGAIKSSMLGNSVVAILKTLNVDELILVNRTELFHLKKFLPKFYMLRLSQNASVLFENMVNDEIIWLKVLCRNQSQHEMETLLR